MTLTRTPAAFAALAVSLTACGATEIDSPKVENLIRDSLAAPEPERVDCPDDVEAVAGEVFYCKVRYRGRAEATITVHMEDDEGRVSFGPEDLDPGG